MGQSTSTDTLPDSVEIVQDEIIRHARVLSEIAFLSYEDFLKSITELNKLTEKCLDPTGKQLVFAIKKGTDSTVLWKGTVRIACVKVDPVTRKIDSCRLLTFNKFMRVFKTLQCQLSAAEGSGCEASCSSPSDTVTASTLFSHVDNIESYVYDDGDDSGDCCICLERKPDVMLPCAHSYCLPCIEQWNVNNKTCPICRENLQSTDDTWVISEAPDLNEVNQEIQSTLSDLASDNPKILS